MNSDFSREFNFANSRQIREIREIREIFFPRKFLTLYNMPETRKSKPSNNEEILLYHRKFEVFRRDIELLITAEIESFMAEHNKKIEVLDPTVLMLQQHVQALKISNEMRESRLDDLEQYGRRLCLRIDGVPSKENETSEDVLQLCMVKRNEAKLKIPEVVINRAHRIGKEIENDGVKTKGIIIRFTTFRHRTMVRNRKKINGMKIKLDLKQRTAWTC